MGRILVDVHVVHVSGQSGIVGGRLWAQCGCRWLVRRGVLLRLLLLMHVPRLPRRSRSWCEENYGSRLCSVCLLHVLRQRAAASSIATEPPAASNVLVHYGLVVVVLGVVRRRHADALSGVQALRRAERVGFVLLGIEAVDISIVQCAGLCDDYDHNQCSSSSSNTVYRCANDNSCSHDTGCSDHYYNYHHDGIGGECHHHRITTFFSGEEICGNIRPARWFE